VGGGDVPIAACITPPQLVDRNGEHGAGHSIPHVDLFVVELSENKKRLVMAGKNA
jgi:hypothetical protein